MEPRVPGQPPPSPGRLVRAVVVQDEVDVQPGRRLGVDAPGTSRTQTDRCRRRNSPMTVPVLTTERREQRGRAVAAIVEGAPIGLCPVASAARRGALEGLNLRLLVDAEHDRVLGRIARTARRCRAPVDQPGVRRQLEGSVRCGCNPKATPDPTDGRVARQAGSPRHGPRARSGWRRAGIDSRVRTTTSSTCASVMRRGAPGRGSSVKPSKTVGEKSVVRHLQTVVADNAGAWRCRAWPGRRRGR